MNTKLNILLKNQGIYNGLIGIVILYGTFFQKMVKKY